MTRPTSIARPRARIRQPCGFGLRDILSSGDRAAVMGLRRGPGQDQYLDSMEEIFAEDDHVWAITRMVLPGLGRPGLMRAVGSAT